MAVPPPGVWGIDLGQCGLKAIRLQEIDGQVVATAFDYVEHPKILSQPDADPDQLTREALDKFLSRNILRGDIVAISVPGQSGLARFVKLPPVEEKKIADIVRFEAKQQIPFNLDEVVWDYQKIGSGVVTDGFAMETEIGLFAMKRDMVSRYLQHFKDVNVDVHLVQMAPLALCNYVAFDLLAKSATDSGEGGEKKCIVALDIGADSSNLVITDGERIIWQRPIPLGGNHFTRALTKDLKLTFAKAEHLKRNATKSPDLKKILAALKPVLNDFVGEVQRSLGYFTNTHRDAHIEYMIGLGNAFRLPGLQKFLSEKLQLDVKKLAKMDRVSGDQVVAQQAYTENVLTFAVAYGLALQGLKQSRLQTNLLPHEIRVERLVKAKKPFAVAAAAALLLAGGGLALSYALEFRTWGHPSVLAAEMRADNVTGQAKKNTAAFADAKKKAREEEDAVRTIVAGQFERANWPELYKFIYTAIPRPDGKPHHFPVIADDGTQVDEIVLDNIPAEFAMRYWDPKGRRANEEYERRHANAGSGQEVPGAEGEPDPSVVDLVQLNIESVQAFYCGDLNAYWDQVKASSKLQKERESLVRPSEHYSKNPTGSGWIVELHGWTYHNHLDSFVKNTLLENLAQLGIQEKKKPTDAAPQGGVPGPAGTVPGAPPGRGPAARPGQPNPGGSEQKDEKEPLGPVINRISHVVLFDWAYSYKGRPFEILTEEKHGEVKKLALAEPAAKSTSGASGMSGPGGPRPPGMGSNVPPGMSVQNTSGGQQAEKAPPTTRSRSEWAPLGQQKAETKDRLGMPGASGPGKQGGVAPSNVGGPLRGGSGGQPPMGRPGMPADKQQGRSSTSSEENALKRTEFVILFIWKEPTDSDDLRGLKGSAPAGGSAMAGGAANPAAKSPPRNRRPKGRRGRRKGASQQPQGK
ncbi:MAG TPA: type IV pilus assembly protein PilM [Gemmataceae bacterium]|nr:type IV pilus assembly protein PilM [Gemmataceae bacterium]